MLAALNGSDEKPLAHAATHLVQCRCGQQFWLLGLSAVQSRAEQSRALATRTA